MPFELKKDPSHWLVVGTGQGWELCPPRSTAVVMCLNDLVNQEQYGIEYDFLCIMDVLDEKPQVVAGKQNLGETIAKINASGKPLIAPYRYAEIPLSMPFPLEDYVKRYGAPYFTNTIAYMIAFALLNGAEKIDVYGINQASSSEYFYEKAGVEYILGIAIGQGVEVTIHGDKSELLANKARFGGTILYGYNAAYENIVADKEKFGEGVVRKLVTPPVAKSRTVRHINRKKQL